jgi:anthranilate synthase/aminodeoxychorismate synthase-like glutamine amidotransferase
MYLIIDNYDSFTYNLVQYLGDLDRESRVIRNDDHSVADIVTMYQNQNMSGILISPGPCTPDDAGVSLALIDACIANNIPCLGICLGHQALGQACGGIVKKAPQPIHGKVSVVEHFGDALFDNLPTPFAAARYHSLIVDKESLPERLEIIALCDDLIMAVKHKDHCLYGVQFHPESIATDNGHKILQNFMTIAERSK